MQFWVPQITQTMDKNMRNGGEPFLFNPDASEFVPLFTKSAETNETADLYNTRSHMLPPSIPLIQIGNNGSIIRPSNISNQETQYFQVPLVNINSDFKPNNYHYFPEPPVTYELNGDDADYISMNSYEEGSNAYVEDIQPPQDDHAEPSIPVVPVTCTPLYGFIGFTYSLPQSQSTSTSNTQVIRGTNGLSIPVPRAATTTSQQVSVASAMPLQIPMPIPVSFPAQQQQQLPRTVQPHAHQVSQSAPSQLRVIVPQPRKPTIPNPNAESPTVTVFVPNISGINQYQKPYPSLIPTIMPQNTNQWSWIPSSNTQNYQYSYK